MTSKRVPATDPSRPGADNFKLINSISPAVERRLHRAGILSFAQLAEMSPESIAEVVADVRGVSAERIAREDWIGQARALAQQQARAAEPEAAMATPTSEEPEMPAAVEQAETAASEARQRYATFTVELLLGPDGEVRRTSVAHIQSGHREPPWSGWDAARLVDCIVQQAGLARLPAKIAVPDTMPPAPAPPDMEPTEQEGALRVREITAVLSGEDIPRHFILHDQPFGLLIKLDLKEEAVPSDQPLSYTIIVHAKKLGSGTYQRVGLARGVSTSTRPLTIWLTSVPLPVGLYRLKADISIKLPSADSAPQSELSDSLEGGLVQIY
jgi:hypothetical protein